LEEIDGFIIGSNDLLVVQIFYWFVKFTAQLFLSISIVPYSFPFNVEDPTFS